jgi:pyrroline-5-carboxylate reductase
MNLKDNQIAFIGGGNMTMSLVSGLIESGFNANQIWVADRNAHKLARLSEQFQIHVTESINKATEKASILVLAVKPKDMQDVVIHLKSIIQLKNPLIVSLASGIQSQHIQDWLQFKMPVVRAMPNTPALLRIGASGLYANLQVTEDQKSLAESLLRAVGITVWVNHESDIDLVAALSGSGPAYFFLIMEALQEGAESLGLAKSTARLLTLQTALGAARMALESDISLEELRKKVMSKGGTTESAMKVLEQGGLRNLLKDTLQAAQKRAVEISALFNTKV